ncbi:hypothetical protein [Luteimonas sp. A649]
MAAWAILLLAPLVACGGEGGAVTTPPEALAPLGQSPASVEPGTPAPAATPDADLPPMMPGRVHAPLTGEVACPSLDFDEFIRAFFNSGDLQVRFTAKPVRYKVPFYDYHNTEPGDPGNPQWETFEREGPVHDRYRYDPHVQAFISDSSRLRPGQQWTGLDKDGQHVPNPVTELSIRKVSDIEYAVDTPGRITTFTQRESCWYLTKDWTLDAFKGCRWPDECRAWREYEAPYYEDD